MKRLILLALSFILLSGCANFEKMDMTLNMMKGKDKSLPFKVLGYPDGSYKIDKDIIYVWQRTEGGVLATSDSYTSYGTVNGKYASATTYGTVYTPTNYSCRIKIVTDSKGIIKDYDFDGDQAGCYPYIRQLWVAKKRGILK